MRCGRNQQRKANGSPKLQVKYTVIEAVLRRRTPQASRKRNRQSTTSMRCNSRPAHAQRGAAPGRRSLSLDAGSSENCATLRHRKRAEAALRGGGRGYYCTSDTQIHGESSTRPMQRQRECFWANHGISALGGRLLTEELPNQPLYHWNRVIHSVFTVAFAMQLQ